MVEQGGYQGMIEYIPGAYAHRPVDAAGYLFIHCIFVGLHKAYKRQGLGARLVDECMNEARAAAMHGVAVVTRKGAFMADDTLFRTKGFRPVDSAPPDFSLLALRLNEGAALPAFRSCVAAGPRSCKKGITVYRSPQCPYTEKNVNAILETAETVLGLDARLVELDGQEEAQQSPWAFGTFCLVHDGEIISYHPISNTRFENIMRKRLADRWEGCHPRRCQKRFQQGTGECW